MAPSHVLLSVAAVAIVYAFVCEVRLSRKARDLGRWVQKERPDLWSELNVVARSWNGGYPGLKLLYRRGAVGLSAFDRQYGELRDLERRLLRGTVVGAVCIGLVAIGTQFLGWPL